MYSFETKNIGYKEVDRHWDGENLLATHYGRRFGNWLDDERNGYTPSDSISNPVYAIESILRDEIFVERDKKIDSLYFINQFDISELESTTDDFYVNALITNFTKNEQDWITAYDQKHKRITTYNHHEGWEVDDNIVISNIDGDNLIDIDSFDYLGNTTNGIIKDNVIRLFIQNQSSAYDVINKILYENFLIINKTYTKYYLKQIFDASTVGTFSTPLIIKGREAVQVSLSDIEKVFTHYNVNYAYDFGTGKYTKQLQVNPKLTSYWVLDTLLKNTCKDTSDNYRIYKNELNVNLDTITDSVTANNFLNNVIIWHSKQRLIVRWAGDFKNYCAYEIGDQVLINYPNMIPDSLNNSANFLITEKNIQISNGQTFINFTLIEV